MVAKGLLFDFHDTLVHLIRPVLHAEPHFHSALRLDPLLRDGGAAVDGGALAKDLLAQVRRADGAAATHACPDIAATVREAANNAGLRLSED